MGGLNSALAMDSSSLSVHQYSQWQEWAEGGRWRRSQQDLMDDTVDAAAERHMYIPLKQAAIPSTPTSAELDSDEMVARVVAFFQNIHNNHALRQLGLIQGEHNQPYAANYPAFHNEQQAFASCNNNDDSFTSTTDAEDVCLATELGLTPSLIAELEELWKRAKQKPATPEIPEWLHHAARQEGRRIRVVTVNDTTDTKTVTCIGCKKNMLAACNVQIVFCPECGCTFAPDMLACQAGE